MHLVRGLVFWIPTLLLLAGTLGLSGVLVEARTQFDRACYGFDNATECSQHQLQCQEGTIFIVDALREFHLRASCPERMLDCNDVKMCCGYKTDDCLENYTEEALSDLTDQCGNQTNCTYRAQPQQRSRCNAIYDLGLASSVVDYLCLRGVRFADFWSSAPVLGQDIVLSYSPLNQTRSRRIACRVEAANCSKRSADVTLVRRPVARISSNCTRLSVDEGERLLCSTLYTEYNTHKVSTPFTVRLQVVEENDAQHAWAVLQSRSSVALQVMCGEEADSASFPSCSPLTMSAAPVTSTASSTKDDAPVTSVPTSETGLIPAGTIGIIGGAVAAAVVVILLVVGVVCFRRRRSHSRQSAQMAAKYSSGQSAEAGAGAGCLDSGLDNPGPSQNEAPQDSVYVDASVPPTHDLAASGGDSEDYDILGKKRANVSPRDVTYGHLNLSGDVTEDDYDHVQRNELAQAPHDVIDNEYSTAYPRY